MKSIEDKERAGLSSSISRTQIWREAMEAVVGPFDIVYIRLVIFGCS
jgi:hypothetical protein